MLLDETLTAREMRAVEMNTEYLGVSKLHLMENAGSAVADAVINRFGKKSSVTIFCGSGGTEATGLSPHGTLPALDIRPESSSSAKLSTSAPRKPL